MVLSNFNGEFGERNVKEITSDETLSFLNRITEGTKQQTKRTRYSHLSALFNFIRNNIDQNLQNPCDTPMMKKIFRNTGLARWNTIEKDTIDYPDSPEYPGIHREYHAMTRDIIGNEIFRRVHP